MDIIAKGFEQKLIRFEDDGRYVVYVHQNMRRSYANPEERVQAETFLQLVLTYKYPVHRVRQYVRVQMGSETKEADIIVYADDALTAPLIIGECKKEAVTEFEFARAADQAVSYAVAEGAREIY
jgi:type I restriction enzyme M protein